MEIGAEEFGDEVTRGVRMWQKGLGVSTDMSSRGEMKMSLRLITCCLSGTLNQGANGVFLHSHVLDA